MELDRFARLLVMLVNESRENEIERRLQTLETALQQTLARQDSISADAFLEERRLLFEALLRSRANSLRPSEAHMLDEIGARGMFGIGLLTSVQHLIDGNSVTPAISVAKLAELKSQVSVFFASDDSFLAGLKGLGITAIADEFDGDAELGVLLPRALVQNNLEGFQREVRLLDVHLRTLGELVDNEYGSPQIRTLSTGSFELFVRQPLEVALLVMGIVSKLVDVYKKTLEVRIIRKKLSSMDGYSLAVETLEKEEDEQVKRGVGEIVADLLEKYLLNKEDGRANELRIKVPHAVSYLAERIDRGADFEASPPRLPSGEEASPGDDQPSNESEQLQMLGAVLTDAPRAETPVFRLSAGESTTTDKGLDGAASKSE